MQRSDNALPGRRIEALGVKLDCLSHFDSAFSLVVGGFTH